MGFPRFAKKGRDRDRVTFTTGAIRIEADRRHVTLPRIGTVRVHENTRRLRPIQPSVACPGSRAGVDVGVRVLATVADSDGEVIERVPNPRPLEAALRVLRRLSRERSRRTRESRRYRETQRKITRLQRRVADIRGQRIHQLTTRLAKTGGQARSRP